MKPSVSLPDEDVAILDEFARAAGLASRSAALQHAVWMLRLTELERDYEAAGRSGRAPTVIGHGRPPPPTGSLMRRGEIRLVDLEPVRGSEANQRRPAVIVSNDRANAVATRLKRGVTVIPVTSNTTQIYPFQTLLPSSATGLRQDPKARSEQVRSVTVERVGALLDFVPATVMAEVDDALRLHLQL